MFVFVIEIHFHCKLFIFLIVCPIVVVFVVAAFDFSVHWVALKRQKHSHFEIQIFSIKLSRSVLELAKTF